MGTARVGPPSFRPGHRRSTRVAWSRSEEALLGATAEAALVLALHEDRGTLEVGKRADFALWRVKDPAELCYWVGSSPRVSLVKDDRPVTFP